MADMTDSPVEMALALRDICVDNMVTWEVEAVYYGDQNKIPVTPVICVESGDRRRSLDGAPRRTLVVMRAYVLIYHAYVASAQEIRLKNDAAVDQVEAALHADPQLGGLLIHGFCTTTELGYSLRSGTLLRSARITYEGTSKVSLPSAP